jgi:MFS family permease
LLQTAAVFAIGFLMRPIGGYIFGTVADRYDRKTSMVTSILMMCGGSLAIGLLPTHDTIGVAAPILLVLLRLVQGLALGGEYGGAATYVAEHAPDGKRGLYTSWIQTTATLGIVTALLVIIAFRLTMGDADFSEYGWRFPFMLSALLVGLSAYLRLKLGESPLFQRLKDQGKASENPMRDTFTSGRNWGLMALALFGFTAPEGVVWYTSQFYALAYMQTVLAIPYITVYAIMIVALVLGAPFFVFWGWLSDFIGRRWIMTAGFLLAALTYWPVFTWLGEFKDNPAMLTLLVWYMVILVTMVYGPIAAFLIELFPAKIRYSSMSLPYHVGNGVFGGGVPFIATYLATTFTGIPLIGLAYPIAVASIGVVVSTLGLKRETKDVKIWDEVD